MGEVVPPILSTDAILDWYAGLPDCSYSSLDDAARVFNSHEELRARVQAAEAERDAALAWKEAVSSESTATLIRTGTRVRALEDALREIVMWCEEGGEPVTAWPAQRARSVLASGEPTATEKCPTCGSDDPAEVGLACRTYPRLVHEFHNRAAVPSTEREEE